MNEEDEKFRQIAESFTGKVCIGFYERKVHTSLNVISERCSSNTPSVAVNVKSVETIRDQYLGILYSTEQYKVFGYITNVRFPPIVKSTVSS